MMSKKMGLGEKRVQSTIVGFLAKTTDKSNILTRWARFICFYEDILILIF